jgi:hypothetical protein
LNIPNEAWKDDAKLDAMSHGFTDDEATLIVGLISEYWHCAYSEGYSTGYSEAIRSR